MNHLIYARKGLIGLLSIALGTLSLHAQNVTHEITITSVGNVHTFSIPTLETDDRVMYRFSDGYHLFAQKTASNVNASVSRSFSYSPVPPKVVGYVAEKGGPLGRALPSPTQPPIATCPGDCPTPSMGLGLNEYIRLGYSWMPFTNTAGLQPLLDPTTATPFSTPGQPWLFLIATMRSQHSGQYAEIDIPNGFTYEGSIFRDQWGQNQTFENTSPIGSIGLVSSGKVGISFNAPQPQKEINVYLLLRGTPRLNVIYPFNGNMYNQNNNLLGTGTVALPGRLFPHDPNTLAVNPTLVCPGVIEAAPFGYRVEFQNIGHAPTEQVKIVIHLPEGIIDPSWLSYEGPQGIGLTGSFIDPQTILFSFPELKLQGLYQLPQPDFAATVGWVNFQARPKNCLTEGLPVTGAVVTFLAEDFAESVETNKVTQNIFYDVISCPKPDIACGPINVNDTSLDGDDKGEGREVASIAVSGASFAPKCYPSLFSDLVNIEIPTSVENNSIAVIVSDLSGKRWMATSSQPTAGEVFRQTLDTAGLPNGMYLVHFIQGTQTAVCKIVKNKL